MPTQERTPTRQRIVAAAMRLFGEQGYTATTVAEIEAAAGLSPGSGSLYRHFRSKQELLAEGVRTQIESGEDLVAFLSDPAALDALPARARLAMVARAGLRRLDRERDLNRLLVRDLARFPDLLTAMREGEIQRIYRLVTQWLATQAPAAERDWAALAAVIIGSVSHYWLLCDVFGEHPSGIDEERYLAALAEMAAGLLGNADRNKEKS
jgi:AcrR family transcriptional regulator